MRKLFLLLTLGVMCLTGCGTMETANEVETEMVEEIQVEEIEVEEIEIEEIEFGYTEEYVEEMKMNTIADIEESWESEGIPEACKDEIIELIRSVKYDASFEYGYDLDTLQRSFVDILVEYDILPDVCAGLNFDEIDELDDSEFEGI